MPVTTSSKPARRFKAGGGTKPRGAAGGWLAIPLVFVLLAALSAAAVWFFYRQGQLYWYGDAESHLNIARRIFDSRTPGYRQIGSVWLPLLHALMVPLARYDELWHNGLAGAIPSAASFVLAGTFLFAAVRRLLGGAPAWAALALFALNPNLLYLQSTAMTEAMFAACLMAMLYFGVLFRDTQSWAALAGAAVANIAASLTRYEGWFLIPFAALYFLIAAKRGRVAAAVVYGALAALGPLYWLAHNRYQFGDFLYFATGPYSAVAIQGGKPYPGLHDWPQAWLYFRTAVRLCAGTPLFWLGLAGAAALLLRRTVWPVLLLALPGVFYVWSMHSTGGTPIFVPELWPGSYYNSRYGLVLLPLLALGGAGLAALAPERLRKWCALAVAAVALSPWVAYPRPRAWVTWQESQINSEGRRAWTREAAEYLRQRYRPGAGIYVNSGDVLGILRAARIPLAEALTVDNEPVWPAAFLRPDLFLREEWAVCIGGDPVQTVLTRARRPYPHYPQYTLVKTIVEPSAPVVEIWRRFTPAATP
jgi:hypothetical protein